MPLTSSMEDYLEAVLIVAKKQIEVRSVDIARQCSKQNGFIVPSAGIKPVIESGRIRF